MNIEQARAAAYTAIEAAAATITPVPPVQFENRYTLDLANVTVPHVRVEMLYGGSAQMSLGNVKVVRYTGVIALIVCVKEGDGLATSTQMMDALAMALQMKNFSGLNTQTAMPQRPVMDKGWHISPLSVPFWFDDIVTG